MQMLSGGEGNQGYNDQAAVLKKNHVANGLKDGVGKTKEDSIEVGFFSKSIRKRKKKGPSSI